MPIDLSIRAVPDGLAEKLRQRAERNHRSLQGELIAILEETLEGTRTLSMDDSIRRLRLISIKTDSER